MSENVLFGGGGCRGSEKLLNFHHLQIMKNIKGAGASELHFITSKNPNIINFKGEVAMIIYIEYLFYQAQFDHVLIQVK